MGYQTILRNENILVNQTAVRVSAFYGYGEALHIETTQNISEEKVKAPLAQASSIIVADNVRKSVATKAYKLLNDKFKTPNKIGFLCMFFGLRIENYTISIALKTAKKQALIQ